MKNPPFNSLVWGSLRLAPISLSINTLINIILSCVSDKTKFGYRMLQRMGWEEGRGLGVREDGREEHIKIQRKKDNSGVCVCVIFV